MANTISFKLKVGDDGTFDIIVDKAKKASKATDQLGASTDKLKDKRNNYSKQEKGVGGLTNNSTKAFAKQAQTIGGGNFGLVGAYAALMANVFALSQAFGFLNRAAGVQQLVQGLQETGAVGGRNLKEVAKNLRSISGGALSAADAMKSVALGTSAGFSTEQMEGLARVATGASKALGRDLTDAMDRLTRGAAKLESEIVDELGIMIRLDDVANDFAATMGKTAAEVTNFEKRMAFTNEIITQGTKKFGEMADAIPTNPYGQLAATFTDLSHAIADTINIAVKPLIGFLAGSPTALLAVISIIGAKIAKSVVPALGSMAKNMAVSAAASAKFAQQNQKAFFRVNALTDATKQIQASMKAGNTTMEKHNEALRTVTDARKANLHALKTENDTMDKDTMSLRTKRYRNQGVAIDSLRKSVVSATAAQIAHKQSQALGYIQAGKYGKALKKLSISFKVANINAITATKGLGFYSKALIFAKVNVLALAGALKVLGVAFLQAIPIIGLVITGFMMLKDAVMFIFRLFVKENPVSKAMKENEETIEGFNEAALKYIQNMESMSLSNERFGRTAKVSAGLIDQTVQMLNKLAAAESQRKAGKQKVHEMSGRGDDLGRGAKKGVKAAAGGLAENVIQMRDAAEFGSPSFVLFNKVLEQTGKISKVTTEKGLKAATIQLGALGLAANSFESNIAQATEGQKAFSTAVTKVLGKKATAYDDINKLLKVNVGLLDSQAESDKQMGVGIAGQAAVLQKILNTKKTITQTDLDAYKASQISFNANVAVLATAKETQGLEAAKLKDLQKYSKENSQLFEMMLNQEDVLLDSKLAAITAEEEVQKALVKQGESSYRLNQLAVERTALALTRKHAVEKEILVEQAQTKEAKKLSDILFKTAKAESDIKNARKDQYALQLKIDKPNRSDATLKNDSLAAAKANRAADMLHIEAVHSIEMTRVDLDFMLLSLRSELLIKELKIKGVEADNIRGMVLAAGKAADSAKILLGIRKENAKLTIDANIAAQKEGIKAGGIATRSGADVNSSGTFGVMQDMMSTTSAQNVVNKDGTTTEVTPGRDLGIAPEAMDTTAEKIGIVNAGLRATAQGFRDLGPDGEAVAGAIEGVTGAVDSMQSAMMVFDEESSTGLQKTAAAFSMAASAIGAISSMQQAASKTKVNAVDREIASEKKRDGQSAKSVAKLQQLEKKKEQMEKKAFETKKKMMLAQAIMSTAAGVAMALTLPPPISFIMAGITGVMGLAQVAMIRKMEFDGGGGSEAPTAPSNINVGARSNSVDLANSQNASGELGYMRGDSGTGNASNFSPAFTGTRYRADGGRVGYMVGEQGPELFMPDSAGEVVSAGETEDAIGGGAPSNVTFNINTLDSSGVEDILLGQRGNIIGMIRDSANNVGEQFLEGVVE